MAPGKKGETPVLSRRVFEGVPEAQGGWGGGVQECAVLVGGDGGADAGLFADYH